MWPLYSGGQVLNQPLAGDEFVVNSKDAAYWSPVLEWMNTGGRPSGGTSGDAGVTPQALRAALSGLEVRLTGAVDTIGDAVAGVILLAYEGAV
jgi:hypothetical protein